MTTDFNGWIPKFGAFNEERAKRIEEKLKADPNSAKNYAAVILGVSKDAKCFGDGEYFETAKNQIAFHIREYKVGNTITLSGYRCFDIVKLSQYLATTRFKI